MSGTNGHGTDPEPERQPPGADALGPIVETVRLTALGLLASLPERPERLRVRAAGVTVDLDWRAQPAPALAAATLPIAGHPGVVPAVPAPAHAAPVASAPALPVEAYQAQPVAAPPLAAHPPGPAGPVAVPAAPPGADPTAHFVCAPAIGTFYHASAPGKPPFVVPGMRVEAGQQVGIIEAMKLMLPVEADRAGQVVRVLVADGEPVQYEERLIELGPVDST
jgi:acetyl-CoA carboxylase biotin carboxyl carrier protein